MRQRIISTAYGVIIVLTLVSAASANGLQASTAGRKSRDAAQETKEKGRESKAKADEATDKSANALGDAAITAAVKTKLLADKDVAGLKIDVDTADGIVTLNGTADTRAEAQHAVTLARNTKGVKRVVNHITVGANRPASTSGAKQPAAKK